MVDGSNTDSLVDRKNSDPLESESIQYSIQDRCVLYFPGPQVLITRTKVILQDFSGPGIFMKKIHGFPGGVGTLNVAAAVYIWKLQRYN